MDIEKIKIEVRNISNELVDSIHKKIYACENHELDVRECGSLTIVDETEMTANGFYAGGNNVRVMYSNNENSDDIDLKYLPVEKLIEIYEFLEEIC